MLEFLATAFVTFFVVIDPIGMIPIYVALTYDLSPANRRQIAVKSVGFAAGVLLVFAVLGDLFLGLLGITLPAVRIAGGILLFLLSIDMIFARQSGIRSVTDIETEEAEKHRYDVAVFPLAVPLIAGPGAITSVLLLTGQVRGDLGLQAVVVILMLVVLGLCLLAFLTASRVMDRLGMTGVNVVGRVLGLIVAALAVQYVLDGITAFLPGAGA